MKFITIFLLCILKSSLIWGQDTLTVVAVGEAEKEKESIGFTAPSYELLNAKQTKDIQSVIEVLKSDFDFYRHMFEVISGTLASGNDFKGTHLVELKISSKEDKLYLNYVLKNQRTKTDVYQDSLPIDFGDIRTLAHSISHNIYRAITGKSSIFKTKIVFVSDRTSTKAKYAKEIYIMDFDGARKQRLTHLNSMIISPALSQDNSKILFTIIESKMQPKSTGEGLQKVKNLNLHMLDLDSKKTSLISAKKGINSGAIFDKSGENIYLTLSFLKNADIYKMNLQSRKTTRVTKHYSDDVDPHINASGSLLTFLSGRPGRAMIYTMDPSEVEKNVKRISFVGEFNASPRFSPDGSQIVFSSWVDNRFDIYRIDSDGRNLYRLTKNFGSNEEPWFSPDGQFIVFTSQRVITKKKAVQDVYIMNKDGEIIRKITENYGKVYTPRWSN